MGVRLERFPAYGVTLEVFTGVLTPELLFERLRALREGDGALWIIYIGPTVARLEALTSGTAALSRGVWDSGRR